MWRPRARRCPGRVSTRRPRPAGEGESYMTGALVIQGTHLDGVRAFRAIGELIFDDLSGA